MVQRVSKGDAEAVLETGPTGGRAILNHGGTVDLGAPADKEFRATIRPLHDRASEGRHYCAEDWHVILVADFDGGDKGYTKQQFEEGASQAEITITLDGAVLPTTRTAVRKANTPPPPFEVAWYFQQGKVMSPGELTVGTHTLGLIIKTATDTVKDGITFYIDAPETGVCS